MRRRIGHVHFVGIGGVGMSGIALLLHDQGYRITGSDLRDGPVCARLRDRGIAVAIGHEAGHVGDADALVYSSAIPVGNPELREAERRGIPVIPRAEMLGEMMRLKDGIAVAGTHGKTTTTSLVAHLLEAAGLDPTAVIGGRVRSAGAVTGARSGGGDWLVAEADESDGSFLRLSPVVAVVTNVEPEHLDHYGDFAAVQAAFVDFANSVPFWGAVVVCIDHPGVQAIRPRITRRAVTYGFSSQAEWCARNVRPAPPGSVFEVVRGGRLLGEVVLPLPGRHNVANSLAALAVADELEVPFERAAPALADFPGVERRFETLGEARGIRVVDDYGHHPTEIRATLAAARAVHPGRVVAVFQPHRYSRTRDLFDDFATAFNDADRVWVTEVYAAGEAKIPGAEGAPLADAIRAHGHRDVHFVGDLDALPVALVGELEAGDLVLTLGAGNVSQVGRALLALLDGEERR
ncbi:MAG: UDP-N-acetylmuramate--L-alanine ligase [Myxococcota bacterium]